MYKIEIGEFDGNSWEDLMQRCLKDKYEEELYQRMPATVNGDSGIEGFTLATGKVFQSYCPDKQYGASELYDKQRDKITTDLNKLVKYKEDLQKVLGDQLITEWHLITPEFTNKALNAHCRTKEKEYRKMKLEHLHPKFKVVINEYTDYIVEITRHMNLMKLKMDISVDLPFEIEWIKCDSTHIENLKRKITNLFDSYNMPQEKKEFSVKTVVDSFVFFYQRGLKVLNKLEDKFPEQYGKLKRIKTTQGENVEMACLMSPLPKNELFEKIQSDLLEKLISELGNYFEESGLEQLSKRIIAEWLMICPLNFGGEL
ncbi:MAG TPA: hypothetical protein DCR69_00185 [Clostridium sp.]|nr:hypothetical protein [Clostridium sp.]